MKAALFTPSPYVEPIERRRWPVPVSAVHGRGGGAVDERARWSSSSSPTRSASTG